MEVVVDVCVDRKQEMLVHYIDIATTIHGETTDIVHYWKCLQM